MNNIYFHTRSDGEVLEHPYCVANVSLRMCCECVANLLLTCCERVANVLLTCASQGH